MAEIRPEDDSPLWTAHPKWDRAAQPKWMKRAPSIWDMEKSCAHTVMGWCATCFGVLKDYVDQLLAYYERYRQLALTGPGVVGDQDLLNLVAIAWGYEEITTGQAMKFLGMKEEDMVKTFERLGIARAFGYVTKPVVVPAEAPKRARNVGCPRL